MISYRWKPAVEWIVDRARRRGPARGGDFAGPAGHGARSAALVLLCAAASACGAGDRGGEAAWAGTVDTLPSGTVVVSNPDAGVWAAGEAWRLVEELRIGTLEGDGPELFGQIRDIEVDPAGRIYVLESQAKEIRVFGPAGEFIRTIGRPGGGPGELNNPSALEWGPDGNLWVVDPGNARFAVFDTAGAYLASHRRPGGIVIVPWPGGFDERGRLVDIGFIRRDNGFLGGRVLVVHDSAFQPVDTLELPDYQGERLELTRTSGNSRSIMVTGVPFSPTLVWRFDQRGYVWFGVNDVYRLHQVGLDGDTLRIVEKAFRTVAVTDEDRREALDNLEWFTSQGGKVDPSRFPDVKPAFRQFMVDPAGRLWVWPVTPDDDPALDLFDPDGRYLGRIRPGLEIQAFPQPVIRGEVIHAVVQDELEVPYVVRMRLVPPEAAGGEGSVGG